MSDKMACVAIYLNEVTIEITKDEQDVLSHLLTCAEKDLWKDLDCESGVISSTGVYVLNKHYYEVKSLNGKLKAARNAAIEMAVDGTG